MTCDTRCKRPSLDLCTNICERFAEQPAPKSAFLSVSSGRPERLLRGAGVAGADLWPAPRGGEGHAGGGAARRSVGWAAKKRFESSKLKFKFPRARTHELIWARSRLYRSQILQVHTRRKALAEIYTMHSFAAFSNLNFFVKNRQNFFAIELMNIH